MLSCFLKRMLPFTLTLIIGAALGNFINLFGSFASKKAQVFTMRRATVTCPSDDLMRGPNIERAVITFQPMPLYTEEARLNRYTGVAKLRVVLDADGTVSSVVPFNALPYGLTEEAIKTAKSIKFIPATLDGVPVSAEVYIEQDFVSYATVSRTFKVTH